MKLATGTTVISNGQLLDGNGGPPVPDAAVVVRDGRIAYTGPVRGAPAVAPDATRLDARGGTIMPGLVEAHFHPTYFNVAALEDLDIKYPVEYVTLLAAANAKLALECGYTAARSGGSLFNIDVWLKKAIESDLCPGPRLAASGREICGVGGLMDWNPDYRKIGMEGLVLLVNGPDEARAAVRKLVKDGVEWVKTYPTGDAAAPDTNDHHTLCMTFEEMHAVVATAHNHKLKVTGHCRATAGIKNALRAGYDTIEHGTFMDDEALDLLLQRDVPCVPALQFELASVERGKEFRLPQKVIDAHQETLEAGAESARKIIRDGGRLGMGGDYGFAWNPHGDYAKELSFFVKYVGLSPLEVIRCATRTGAEMALQRNSLLLRLGQPQSAEIKIAESQQGNSVAKPGGDHGPRRRVRHAGARQARRRAGRGRRRGRGHLGAGGPHAVHRRHAGRRREGGPRGGAMTEEDWLACGDQAAMLELLRGRTSPRKLRLAAVACCHGFWTADLDPRLEKAFQVAHQYADQLVSDQERDAAFREARVAGQARYSQLRRTELHEVAIRDTQYRFSLLVGFAVGGRAGDLQTHIDAPGSELLRALPAIIREVFGNPFRPVTFSPEWRTPTSVALARQMYESREFSAMPILADALQDAGCDSEDILTHCRDPRLTHVRGCWVVDLVLGKT